MMRKEDIPNLQNLQIEKFDIETLHTALLKANAGLLKEVGIELDITPAYVSMVMRGIRSSKKYRTQILQKGKEVLQTYIEKSKLSKETKKKLA